MCKRFYDNLSHKMRIQIISELHQEFGITDLNFENAHIVILAGDTNLGTKGVELQLKGN